MTINEVKLKLLSKTVDLLSTNDIESATACVGMYSTLCHADTQDKMTEATIHGGADPFRGLSDDEA